MIRKCFLLVLFYPVLAVPAQEQKTQPAWYARSFPCGSREATEEFLRTAPIVKIKDLGEGVTHPRKVTLDNGTIRHDAIFKDIDLRKVGVTVIDGRPEVDFKDSWKFEVAACEIDKLLGLDMVPVTVERTINGRPGSLQIWIDGCISESARQKKHLECPDVFAWNYQLHKMHPFDNLIFNIDRNLGNLLISPEWKIYMIDHSRSFKNMGGLKTPKRLVNFSRSVIDALGRLDEATLTERCGNYLRPPEIDSLLERRDRIVQRCAEMVAEQGEKVLYP